MSDHARAVQDWAAAIEKQLKSPDRNVDGHLALRVILDSLTSHAGKLTASVQVEALARAHDPCEVATFGGSSKRTTITRCTVCGMLMRDVVGPVGLVRHYMPIGKDAWTSVEQPDCGGAL